MLLPILLAAGLILFFLVVLVAGRPDAFTVARTASFAAPVDAVFPHVDDLRLWNAWSPWAKLDPNAKHAFEGPATGTGAVMTWSGNGKVGEGRMTIARSRANDSVGFTLEFIRPFRATNTAEFTFRTAGAKTEVTWRMSGRNNFFFKCFGLFMDCETMVGRDFEKGLASLRTLVEKPSHG